MSPFDAFEKALKKGALPAQKRLALLTTLQKREANGRVGPEEKRPCCRTRRRGRNYIRVPNVAATTMVTLMLTRQACTAMGHAYHFCNNFVEAPLGRLFILYEGKRLHTARLQKTLAIFL
ncbi:hypothetical protein [Burkholderia sp. Ac-20365]|uniref:hypothetical protein n=1 Tax=Burkholderia sp. Ac-20365 TaxID=2703897 RepID=UPI00197B9884|nr:hypothetical protein [Burkholderia sp. Ac-20365]MBN3761352.1 hypothetical protein [Burkholderia sp. Ac-20365]